MVKLQQVEDSWTNMQPATPYCINLSKKFVKRLVQKNFLPSKWHKQTHYCYTVVSVMLFGNRSKRRQQNGDSQNGDTWWLFFCMPQTNWGTSTNGRQIITFASIKPRRSKSCFTPEVAIVPKKNYHHHCPEFNALAASKFLALPSVNHNRFMPAIANKVHWRI